MTFTPSLSQHDLHDVDHHRDPRDRVGPHGPRVEADPRARPERVRVVLRVPERLRDRHRRRRRAKPYIPLFIAFFLLILFSNWSGLVPPVGRLEQLRAPTSDVNVTLGLALVSFAYFEFQGFRRLGVRGYLGKFFPIYEFKNGIGSGVIAMFVGLVELMLEFVKPVTLSMRLFGNIYGGEVALGVITALTSVHPGRPPRPRGDAQRHPGADLQHPVPHVHRARDREPSRRGRPRRRGGDRRHRRQGAVRGSQPAH